MEAEFYDYEKNDKWRKIFRNMNTMSRIFPSKESRKIENKPLNRYTDVVPYDKTRVVLERYNLNYINASYVAVPLANRKYILTQGPLPNTSGHFWLMVWEQKSRAILMLNNLIECGNIKCHKYWPDGGNDVDELLFDDVSLKVQLKSAEKFNYYMLRVFILYDLISETSREILHFHYTSWPDFDLPKSCDSFLEFLSAVRQSDCLNIERYGPPVIHCSAGIGRSGTVVLVDSCLVMIEKNGCLDSINIIDVLLELRTYRMGLIQTSDQLRFSFLAILQGSKQLINRNESNLNNETQQSVNNNDNKMSPTKSNVKIKRSFGIVDSSDNDVNTDTDSNNSDNERSVNEISEQNMLPNVTTQLVNNNSDNSGNANIENNVISANSTDNESLQQQHLRQRKLERDEKNRRTMETIQRIKRKQKEMEDRLKLYKKFENYFRKFSIYFGVAICFGLAIYYYKRTDFKYHNR